LVRVGVANDNLVGLVEMLAERQQYSYDKDRRKEQDKSCIKERCGVYGLHPTPYLMLYYLRLRSWKVKDGD